MRRRLWSILLTLALFLTSAAVCPAGAADAYLIENFDGYADAAALGAAWTADGVTLSLDNGALKAEYKVYGIVYSRRPDFKITVPEDAAGIGFTLNSTAATKNLKLRLITGTDEHRFVYPLELKEGENRFRIAFDAAGWSRVGGWGNAGVTVLPKAQISAVQFESSGGVYTLHIDDIRFLKASELEEQSEPEVPQEPTLPEDAYVLDDFEGYANSASLGYGNLWQNNSGGANTVTVSLDRDAGHAHAGAALKIAATDKGWVTVTRNSVQIPADATSMTFWARAEAETGLKLEFRLNNNSYKYAPAQAIKVGTEGALYTVYFEDVAYVPGSGDDKGWTANDRCLVNAINFMRDGYSAMTLYLDDISFGTEPKPLDPDSPIAKLQEAIEQLPETVTLGDVEAVESVYAQYAALTAEEKKTVKNRQKLLDAKELTDAWRETLGDRLDTVRELGDGIAALPEAVTERERAAVEALWKTYTELNEEQQKLVPGYETLEAAHQALSGGQGPAAGAALPAAGMAALLAAGAAVLLCGKKRG